MATPTNLYQYYTSKGQNLPSVSDRAPIYEQYGLGSAGEYTGTAQQNTNLLGKLLGENQTFVSGSKAKGEAKQYGADLNELLNKYSSVQQSGDVNMETYSDPMTQMLDRQMQLSDLGTQQLISGIQAKRQQRENEMKNEAELYKSGLQLLGVQGTGAQSSPDLLQGQITGVNNQLYQRLSNLDREESMAILDATRAKEDNNIQLLKERMNYIKEIKREKQDALKQMYEQLSYQTKISDIKAAEIFDVLNTLDESQKEEFLRSVAESYGIPVGSLVSALGREKLIREEGAIDLAKKKKSLYSSGSGTGSSGGKNYTATNIPDDILNSIRDDISTYDDLTIDELIGAYPEVSSSYLNSLYNQLKKDGSDPFSKYTPSYKDQEFKRKKLRKNISLTNKLEKVGITMDDVQKINEAFSRGYDIDQILKTYRYNAEQAKKIRESIR